MHSERPLSSIPACFAYQGHQNTVWSLAWSPNSSRLASASGDGTVQIWEVATRRLLYTCPHDQGAVTGVTWSPDGSRLAFCTSVGTVQVWTATGQLLLTFAGHARWATGISWSPDGTRLASASEDQTVKVWEAATGSPLLTYTGH